jgi:hypothetical protein
MLEEVDEDASIPQIMEMEIEGWYFSCKNNSISSSID